MSTDVLGSIPLFAKLPDDERTELARLLKRQDYPAHKPVVWLGDKGQDFFIVKHGNVIVSCPDEAGKEVILTKLGPGHFFGEISLLDGGPRTANVRTIVDSEMMILSREDFLGFLRRHPDAAIYMLEILGQRQRDTNDKIRGIRNVNEAVAAKQTRWNMIAERIATITASQWFVLLNVSFAFFWVTINSFLVTHGHKEWAWDEPPSFGVLGFAVTLEALFISLFVLISQGQQGERDRVRADMDYQVNLKAHQEVMQLHQKVDRLQTIVGQMSGSASKESAEKVN